MLSDSGMTSLGMLVLVADRLAVLAGLIHLKASVALMVKMFILTLVTVG